jgi:hypothetical protein
MSRCGEVSGYACRSYWWEPTAAAKQHLHGRVAGIANGHTQLSPGMLQDIEELATPNDAPQTVPN